MKVESILKPHYMRVQEVIRDRILSGEWEPGEQIPTERELEKEFSLSRMTISKGLANLVSEGFLLRRQGQGTFVALASTREDAPRLIKYISPLGRRGEIPVRYGVLEAMHDSVAASGYEIGIDFYGNADEQTRFIKRDKDSYHSGFIIFFEPGETNLEELKRLKEDGYPFVLIDAYPYESDVDFAVTDNIEGGRIVVERLAQLGHQRISYVTRPIDRSSLSDRLSGFLKGLVMHDLPFTSDTVRKLVNPGNPALAEIGPVMDSFLDVPKPPTAIMFSNDDLALEAMDYLYARGIRIPEDISIIGYDNIDRSSTSRVRLTTVAQDFYEMARRASEILLQKVEGRVGLCSVQSFIKPRLIVRDSVCSLSEPISIETFMHDCSPVA